MSVTVLLDPKVKQAIAGISDDVWRTIEYTDTAFGEAAGVRVSRAEVAKTPLRRVHLEENRPTRARAVGGPPHPRPQPPRRW